MTSIEYKVPRILWENLESVLLAQSRRYVEELANKLGVSAKELTKKVLPSSDSLKVMILDYETDATKCKAYIQEGNLTVHCRKPVVFGCEFCAFHKSKRMTVVDGTNPVELQKVKDINTLEPMWINKTTLYNSNGSIIGKLNTNKNKIKIFTIDTEL